MKVFIKQFDVGMEVKSKGIEFEVRTPDGRAQLGDIVLTKSGIEWCKGKVARGNGIKKRWEDVIALLEDGKAKS